ncbi:uncharacterized protein B0T23DRAFT_440691 [Neurospora hispaniola]|uniref:Uncharacterized protein n=1 Tax=Neurospora hispaniola TaxID=588809 RepID=A0AAJ0MSR5_9PEZI|nr:hypothetical protein B0T23DRAFT_440691 [Neurospora hispaniola]
MALQNSNVHSSERMCALPDRASCSQHIIAQAHGPPVHHLVHRHPGKSVLEIYPNCREPEVEAGEDRTGDLGDFTTQCPVSWKIRVRCFYAQVWPPADIPELLLCSTVKAKRSSDSNQGISG